MEEIDSRSTVITIQDIEQGTQTTATANISTSQLSIQIHDNHHSPLIRLPSRELLDDRNAFTELCLPLQEAAKNGNWGTAKRIIDRDPRTLTSTITDFGGKTLLHLVSGTKNVDFVDRLVHTLSEKDLELQDENGNTGLCLAAATAPTKIAKIMIERNPSLASIRGGSQMTPLYMATSLNRNTDMAHYLYTETHESLTHLDRIGIFFNCIDSDIYDLALIMLNDDVSLAIAEDDVGKTALHHLAETTLPFSRGGWTNLPVPWLNSKFKRNSNQTTALELVRRIWEEVWNQGRERALELISSPTELLFDAAKLGNYEFIQVLVSSCPDLVWTHDSENRTIFHFAVLYRHVDIFNMIHGIDEHVKNVIVTYEDSEGNNILHLAAKLPRPDRLKTVSGAALQMQKELFWFEEANDIVLPKFRRKTNNNNMNPTEIFSSEHMMLISDGEKWLKDTSHSGLIVSTIITTVVFAAAFSLPGGNSNLGSPTDLRYTSFLVFMLSDGLAMLSSVIASLMFLSILTSRFTEHDFRKSLPLKLMTGLTALFVSNIAMMVAFCSTVAIACHDGWTLVPYFISFFAFVPIALFGFSQFPLWFDTFRSTYRSRTIFNQTRQNNAA